MSIHQENQQLNLTFEQLFDIQVAVGKIVCFTDCTDTGKERTYVSPRAAVWLLQALEGKLENYDPEAVAQGRATRIEYQYGTHRAVLGTYSILETYDFWRGILHYCKREMKDAQRKGRQAKRARVAAEKGGLTL